MQFSILFFSVSELKAKVAGDHSTHNGVSNGSEGGDGEFKTPKSSDSKDRDKEKHRDRDKDKDRHRDKVSSWFLLSHAVFL